MSPLIITEWQVIQMYFEKNTRLQGICMGHVKWKSAFNHAQNMLIQIILGMRKVPFRFLLLFRTFCSSQ